MISSVLIYLKLLIIDVQFHFAALNTQMSTSCILHVFSQMLYCL